MKALKLTLASLLLSGCLTTPGMYEPMVVSYVIVDGTRARCIPEDICPAKEKSTEDMIGFQCVNPNAAAILNNHHDTLHEELNKYKQ